MAAHEAISRARLESPGLRRMWLEELSPLNVGELFTAPTHCFVDRRVNPLLLVASEKLNALMLATSVKTTYGSVLVWLADGAPTPITGEVHTMRADATAPTNPDVWENEPIAFSQTLPAGRYAVVGMRVNHATGIAARLVFVGGTWRPGCPITLDVESEEPDVFRNGLLGSWGEFEFDQPPTVDLLMKTVGPPEIYLDLIQVRAGRS